MIWCQLKCMQENKLKSSSNAAVFSQLNDKKAFSALEKVIEKFPPRALMSDINKNESSQHLTWFPLRDWFPVKHILTGLRHHSGDVARDCSGII